MFHQLNLVKSDKILKNQRRSYTQHDSKTDENMLRLTKDSTA